LSFTEYVEIIVSNYFDYPDTDQYASSTDKIQSLYGDLRETQKGGYTRFPDGGKHNTYIKVFIMKDKEIIYTVKRVYNGDTLLVDPQTTNVKMYSGINFLA
jgi:hypothetical protein